MQLFLEFVSLSPPGVGGPQTYCLRLLYSAGSMKPLFLWTWVLLSNFIAKNPGYLELSTIFFLFVFSNVHYTFLSGKIKASIYKWKKFKVNLSILG